jgi:hypothetical protein
MRIKASIDLASQITYRIEYEWIVLNDGGDFQVIAWEIVPGAPTDSVPDQMVNKPCDGVRHGEFIVRETITKQLIDLIKGFVQISFE